MSVEIPNQSGLDPEFWAVTQAESGLPSGPKSKMNDNPMGSSMLLTCDRKLDKHVGPWPVCEYLP